MIMTDGMFAMQNIGGTGQDCWAFLASGTMPTPAQLAAWYSNYEYFGYSATGTPTIIRLVSSKYANGVILATAGYVMPEIGFKDGYLSFPFALLTPREGGTVITSGTPTWGGIVYGCLGESGFANNKCLAFHLAVFSVGNEFSNADVILKGGNVTAGSVFKLSDLNIPYGGSNILC